MAQRNHAVLVPPGSFQPETHFYPKVLNASLHPMVKMFMSLGNIRIAKRYCHLHPETNLQKLLEIFEYSPSFFLWAGSDLFSVTNEHAQRQMIVIETNSCPSGQKSMPYEDSFEESSGFYSLINHSVKDILKEASLSKYGVEGKIAVVYDKNHMEASGYAAAIADCMKEEVYLVEYYHHDSDPPVKWIDKIMYVNDRCGGAFKYVTQKPWNRFPVDSKTVILNSIVSCLAGGRNKLVASKAYELLNLELGAFGLNIRTPDTVTDVSLSEIPMYVKSMGMKAVVKIPYSNAGQGVFTITNKDELDEFMALRHHYDKFIVQGLVGNSGWSSSTRTGTYYHVGTVPDKRNETYVFDLRMMVGGSPSGFKPIAVYARRASVPLSEDLKCENSISSWDMLGTNLSIKTEKGWSTDTNRLVLMDNKDFNKLGIGLDDLIDGYVQTVLCTLAIDKMCHRLVGKDGFNFELFGSVDQDEALLTELRMANPLN